MRTGTANDMFLRPLNSWMSILSLPELPGSPSSLTVPIRNEPTPVRPQNPADRLVEIPCETAADFPVCSNRCGQIALATVCKAYGCEVSSADLDATNPADIYTAPANMVRFLEARCGARQRNCGTVEQLCAEIDRGRPAIALVDAKGTPHWVTVSGYVRNESGRISEMLIRDRALGNGALLMDAQSFEAIWRSPVRVPLLPSGLCRYEKVWIQTGKELWVLSIGPFATASDDLLATSGNDLVCGLKNRSIPQLIRGTVELAAGAWSAPPAVLGRSLTSGGERLIEIGRTRRRQGGVANAVIGTTGVIAGKLAQSGGVALDTGANVIATGGQLLGDGIERLGNAAEEGLNRTRRLLGRK